MNLPDKSSIHRAIHERHHPGTCIASGCDTPRAPLSKHCDKHRQRRKLKGATDKRIPSILRLRPFVAIAGALLAKEADNPALNAFREAIITTYRRQPCHRVKGQQYKGSAGVRLLLGETAMHPKFSPDLILARACLAFVLERSGHYTFPNPTAFQAFLGRCCIIENRRVFTGHTVGVAKALMPLLRPVINNLVPAVVKEIERLLNGSDKQTTLLCSYLFDCEHKPYN